MLIGRETELNQLEQYYKRDGSQIVVLYGQKNIGKTSLVKHFAEDKDNVYYQARTCSEQEQRYQWAKEMRKAGNDIEPYPSYTDIFRCITEKGTAKQIVVVDEFQYIVKTGSSFMEELVSFVRSDISERRLLVILCSSSIGWVENSMLQKLGRSAYSLSGLMKLKELKFADLAENFSSYSMEQCLECYSILGGVPGLWRHFNENLSVKENIIKNMLSQNGSLNGEAMALMTEELREPAIYSTILSAIAEGKHKLNDLYIHTGFSRAKISVYLKNLMELEIVEKVFSFETEGRDQTQKGVYRIKNHLMYFYFRFIYPSLSDLQTLDNEKFFDEQISRTLGAYAGEFFKDVCMELLEDAKKRGNLAVNYVKCGEWIGKKGSLDVVAQDAAGNMLVAKCFYDKPLILTEDYEEILQNVKRAKINADHIYLFTDGEFDKSLLLETDKNPNLHLFAVNAR